jgi:hypothetical protein
MGLRDIRDPCLNVKLVDSFRGGDRWKLYRVGGGEHKVWSDVKW